MLLSKYVAKPKQSRVSSLSSAHGQCFATLISRAASDVTPRPAVPASRNDDSTAQYCPNATFCPFHMSLKRCWSLRSASANIGVGMRWKWQIQHVLLKSDGCPWRCSPSWATAQLRQNGCSACKAQGVPLRVRKGPTSTTGDISSACASSALTQCCRDPGGRSPLPPGSAAMYTMRLDRNLICAICLDRKCTCMIRTVRN